MSLWLVIPTRGLAAGKTRLSSVLSAKQRIEFNTLCINGLLSAFGSLALRPSQFGSSSAKLQQCIVVSPSVDARTLALNRGARALDDGTTGDLNAALRRACEVARINGADHILVLAADLPLVRGHHLAELIESNLGNSATLIADKTGQGTNGLLLPANAASGFAFGEGSLQRHQKHFVRAGLAVTIWRDPALAFDIDTPDDLAAWQRTPEALKLGGAAVEQTAPDCLR
jgi:2-phospho-L-lactate guanylyltransferase